ncbi:hypothetical protein COV82_01935 [Candidatus Peregrinibacteria bacterium CG11_big_fil_rev_8_21_14_0_20_46_8]|nr:MAG: hypothetical protein COV82_01935 [Candidatus Peregrinibacteria bacterium CG11_big_fil_rev_8_21_14_0_20_46_8]
MPGQVSRQSTQALSTATAPYLLKMAKVGVSTALLQDTGLRRGLNTFYGQITYEQVAKDLGLEDKYTEAKQAIMLCDERCRRAVSAMNNGAAKKSLVMA